MLMVDESNQTVVVFDISSTIQQFFACVILIRRFGSISLMGQHVVLVVGSGGREHALCKAIAPSTRLKSLHCTPGNAGTERFATNHSIAANDIDGIVQLAQSLQTSLVVAGPEAPLCDGLTDALSLEGIPCFGPVAALAHLEGSKKFAKEMMSLAAVPTATYIVVDQTSDIEACLDQFGQHPWVIKRDVLAGGKGVVVTEQRDEARAFITSSIRSDGYVLLEEFLPGEEASMLVIMDRDSFIPLPCSQDHKRALDGDLGPNTGGMGAYCPAPLVDQNVHDKVIERIVRPMHTLLAQQDQPYRGVLYVGLMVDGNSDPHVVEFNVRFGDPECQVTLPLIDSDVLELLYAAATDTLSDYRIEISDSHVLTVVLASEGYPQSAIKGRIIEGLAQFQLEHEHDGVWINHAATKRIDEHKYISTGGRVLSVTAQSSELSVAMALAYDAIKHLRLEGSHYRSDIGGKAIQGN